MSTSCPLSPKNSQSFATHRSSCPDSIFVLPPLKKVLRHAQGHQANFLSLPISSDQDTISNRDPDNNNNYGNPDFSGDIKNRVRKGTR